MNQTNFQKQCLYLNGASVILNSLTVSIQKILIHMETVIFCLDDFWKKSIQLGTLCFQSTPKHCLPLSNVELIAT